MAWIDQRPGAAAPANYRYTKFYGARILQSDELNDFQDLESRRGKNDIGCLFREGAIVNMKATVNGLSITLEPDDTSRPMLAFFNGSFEEVPTTTLTFAASKQTGVDHIYLNWVHWRVTHDGAYQGSPGALTDPTLVDDGTGEAVGERGQLQIVLSLDETLANEPLNPTSMLAKNTTSIKVMSLAWVSGLIVLAPISPIQPSMLAHDTRYGFVRLSDGTSNAVAVGHTDPRMTNERTPTNASVFTDKVKTPELNPGQTTSINTPAYRIASNNGGILSSRVIWETLQCSLLNGLDWLYTKITSLITGQSDHETRIAALEGKEPPKLDLSYHVGKRLSSSVHPPRSNEEFVHEDGKGLSGAGQFSFRVKDAQGVTMGGIQQNGDFSLDNPQLSAQLASYTGGAPVNSFYKLAQYMILRLNAIQNQSN